jgi:uncharacterized membrane protein YdjX (TVP38/TMEM64 family)
MPVSSQDATLENQKHGEPEDSIDETDQGEFSEEEIEKERRWKIGTRVALGLALIGFIVFIITDSLTTGYVRDGIKAFLEWTEDNPATGFFLFTVVYFVATILFIPGSILTLGAGFVFGNAFPLGVGILLGTVSVFLGASTGAIVSFYLGRYLLRDWVAGLASKYAIFEALDAALQDKGFRIMALLRLSPIIPFNAINYIAGVTAISTRDYCLSLFAIIPGTTLFVFLGASAGSLTDSAKSREGNMTVTIIVVVVGVVFGVGAIFLTSYYAKNELDRVLAERRAIEFVAATGNEEAIVEHAVAAEQDEENAIGGIYSDSNML